MSEEKGIFSCKLTQVGTIYSRGDYSKMQNSNPLQLIFDASRILCRDLTHKESTAQMRFDLARLLLQTCEFDKTKLLEALEQPTDKILSCWKAEERKAVIK